MHDDRNAASSINDVRLTQGVALNPRNPERFAAASLLSSRDVPMQRAHFPPIAREEKQN